MMLRASVWCLIAAACLGAARPAVAQDMGNCQTSKQWTMDRLTKDHWKLIGQVEVYCGDQSFSADEIEGFNDTHKMIATGNVVFTHGTSRIAADRMEYNTETKTGTFFNATGTATMKDQNTQRPGQPVQQTPKSLFGTQEPDVYFYGEKIAKVGNEKYRITKGGFTTCVQPTPRWQLTSGTVILNLERYAFLTNSLLKVKSVPVFYLPVMYYPINKEDRATGFLLPMYGSSTIRGQTLSNAFFWAINRSHDATFYHDWFATTGQGFGSEYRYVASPGSEGQIRFYNLREHTAEYTDDDGSVTTTPERTSYQIQGSLSQRLGRAFRARGRVNYFSDITVQQTYQQNVYNASQRQRVVSGSVSGVVSSWNLTGSYDRSEFFYGTTQSTVRGGTPRISLQRADKPLFGSPIYFSVNTEAVHLVAERKTSSATVDQGVTRFDLFPRVRIPFTKWQFLTISTSAAFRETFWTEQRDVTTTLNVEDPINRNYYDLSAQITGPVFARIFNRTGSQYAEKLKHSIEPYFNLQRISPIDDFDKFVQIDGTDVIVGRVSRIAYGVTNRFFRKPGGGGRSRELLTASLGQSYYSDQRAAQYDKNYQTSYGSAPSHFSPLSLQVRSTPTDTRAGPIPDGLRHDVQRHPHDDGRRDGVGRRLASFNGGLEPAAIHRGSARVQRSDAPRPLPEQRDHLEGVEQSAWRGLQLQLRRAKGQIPAAAHHGLLQRAMLWLCARVPAVQSDRDLVQPGARRHAAQFHDHARGHRVVLQSVWRHGRRIRQRLLNAERI